MSTWLLLGRRAPCRQASREAAVGVSSLDCAEAATGISMRKIFAARIKSYQANGNVLSCVPAAKRYVANRERLHFIRRKMAIKEQRHSLGGGRQLLLWADRHLQNRQKYLPAAIIKAPAAVSVGINIRREGSTCDGHKSSARGGARTQ